MKFWKYQGAGNDFVMMDDREQQFDIQNVGLIAKLCDRRFGIGADGLILLRMTEEEKLHMIYFNSDGRQSSMCGNGGRCFAAFALNLGLCNADSCEFLAIDGWHEAQFEDEEVDLHMIDVGHIEKLGEGHFTDTGSPHVVIERNNLSEMDLIESAHAVRYNDRFASDGTNVNFVSYRPDYIQVRTYERGVEDETLACGTGVTAVALVADQMNKNTHDNASVIHAAGGVLQVRYQKEDEGYTDIWLKGPAKLVFEGDINLQEL